MTRRHGVVLAFAFTLMIAACDPDDRSPSDTSSDCSYLRDQYNSASERAESLKGTDEYSDARQEMDQAFDELNSADCL